MGQQNVSLMIRSINGELLGEFKDMPRKDVLQHVRSALLQNRTTSLQSVRLLKGAAVLDDDSQLDGEAVAELTALFFALELPDEIRQKLCKCSHMCFKIVTGADTGNLSKDEVEMARADETVLLHALQSGTFGWHCLQHAHISLLDDSEFMLNAVNHSGRALKFAGPMCRDDREVVLRAMLRSIGSFEFAGPKCKDDREIVLKAVERSGRFLKFAGPTCRDDHEIVFRAVEQFGDFLEFAGPTCKDDRGIVLKALEHDGRNLQYAGPRAKDDHKIVFTALEKIQPYIQLRTLEEISAILGFAGPTCEVFREVVFQAIQDVKDGHVSLEQTLNDVFDMLDCHSPL